MDYRQFRFKKMNTPEFSHVKLLLFWPFFGLMFMFLERFQPERHYYVVHCALDDLIPFWEWALTRIFCGLFFSSEHLSIPFSLTQEPSEE